MYIAFLLDHPVSGSGLSMPWAEGALWRNACLLAATDGGALGHPCSCQLSASLFMLLPAKGTYKTERTKGLTGVVRCSDTSCIYCIARWHKRSLLLLPCGGDDALQASNHQASRSGRMQQVALILCLLLLACIFLPCMQVHKPACAAPAEP